MTFHRSYIDPAGGGSGKSGNFCGAGRCPRETSIEAEGREDKDRSSTRCWPEASADIKETAVWGSCAGCNFTSTRPPVGGRSGVRVYKVGGSLSSFFFFFIKSTYHS